MEEQPATPQFDPCQHVVKAGWSWGGQFMDVDNDGYLDLYVTNGFRTTPEAISTPVDT